MLNRANLLLSRQLRFSLLFTAFAVLLSCLMLPGLSAQTDTGTIVGTVTDATGAIIPGAPITATNTENGSKLTAVSNDAGEFNILAVPRGVYTVQINVKGFQPQTTTVTITVATTQNVIFKLNPSGGSTTVEVTTESPLIDVSDATIGATIQGEQVTDLPLNGRNFTQLALLTPGVTRGAYGDVASGGGSANMTETIRNNESGNAALSVNGLRPQANNFILDGVDNNDGLVNGILFFPNIDATQEFKVNTSVAPAEYGRAGGAIVVMSIKNGTNQYHGSAFWFYRDKNFDSNPNYRFNGAPAVNPRRLPAPTARLLGGRAHHQKQTLRLRRLPGIARDCCGFLALPDGSHYKDAHRRLFRVDGSRTECRGRLHNPVPAVLSGLSRSDDYGRAV